MLNESSRVCAALPSFFRACVLESARSSYFSAGYHLAINMRGIVEGYVDDAVIEELDELINNSDAEGIVAWVSRVLPRCMRLVPSPRRYGTFLAGIRAAMEDERI